MLFFFVVGGAAPEERVRQAKVDEKLFERIGAGDPAALETLYLQTERAIYAYTLSILKNPDDTVDIVQDTYIKVRAAAHLYKPMGKPLAWMFTIARNLCMNHLRQRKASMGVDIETLEQSMEFACVSDPVDRLVLEAALACISEEERQIVMLHAICGMRHHEIARDLDIPLSTALSRYHRALKKLRTYLAETGVAK